MRGQSQWVETVEHDGSETGFVFVVATKQNKNTALLKLGGVKMTPFGESVI